MASFLLIAMPHAICLAASLVNRPYRQERRKKNFISNFVLCCALRNSSSETSSSRERVLSLIESYDPAVRGKLKTLDISDLIVTFNMFLEWGFSDEDLDHCVRLFSPILGQGLGRIETLFESLVALGCSFDDIKCIVIRYPQVVRCTEKNFNDFSKYMSDVLELTNEELIQMIIRQPSVLTLSAQDNVIPTCKYFINVLGMDSSKLAKALVVFPQLLGCSLEKKIKPIVHYIIHELQVPQEVFVKKLGRNITLLGRCPDTLRSRVQWLQATFGYSVSEITNFLSLSTSIFTCSDKTLQKKIENLCIQFDVDLKECGIMLQNYPQTLTLSVENVNRKIEYFTKTMHRDIQEVGRTLRILSCSLERRIKPRYETLTTMQFPQEKYSLITLFCSNDEQFERLIQRHLSH